MVTIVKIKNLALLISALILSGYLLSACSKDDTVITELGIDGYVYVAENLSEEEDTTDLKQALNFYGLIDDLQVFGDYLYYRQVGNSVTLKRITLEDEMDLSAGEVVLNAAMSDFAVDSKECIWYFEQIYPNAVFGETRTGGNLYKISEDCALVVELELNGNMDTIRPEACLAVDGEDRAYLLMEEGIHILNADGSPYDIIPTENCKNDTEFTDPTLTKEGLYSDKAGKVYYSINGYNASRLFEVMPADASGMKEIHSLSGYYFNNICKSSNGSLLLSDPRKGLLYKYSEENTDVKEFLRWQDSNLFGEAIQLFAQLDDDRLLVHSDYLGEESWYMLYRTPIEELPPKEILVLASLDPTQDLREFVVEFNKKSDKYHVIIESYGATGENYDVFGTFNDQNGVLTRLDATLVSSNSPDMLDLFFLDVGKYAEKGVLEDLFPYLEESPILDKEDFLDNVIEGYTIEGRLIGIPESFIVEALIGRTSQLEQLDGWGIKDMMKLTELYPDAKLFYSSFFSDYYDTNQIYLLEQICAPYYLEQFVDKESGKCNFDTEEFRSLLQWVKNCPLTDAYSEIPVQEDCLLIYKRISYFSELDDYDEWFNEKTSILGYPTVDGGRIEQYGIMATNVLGIISTSEHKEGAWEFIEAFLSQDLSDIDAIPAKTESFYRKLEENLKPKYSYDFQGNPIEIISDPNPRKELVDAFVSGIISTCFSPGEKYEYRSIVEIISEEAASYLFEEKPLEEVTDIIQSRVSLLLSE